MTLILPAHPPEYSDRFKKIIQDKKDRAAQTDPPSNATCMGSGPDLTLFSPCSPVNPGVEKIFHLCFLPLLVAVSRYRF